MISNFYEGNLKKLTNNYRKNAKLAKNLCNVQYLLLILQTNNRNNLYYEFAKECVGSDSE